MDWNINAYVNTGVHVCTHTVHVGHIYTHARAICACACICIMLSRRVHAKQCCRDGVVNHGPCDSSVHIGTNPRYFAQLPGAYKRCMERRQQHTIHPWTTLCRRALSCMTVSSEMRPPSATGEKEEEVYRKIFEHGRWFCARPGKLTTADS